MILQAYGWRDGWSVVMSTAANCPGLSTGSMEVGKNIAIGEAAYGPLIDNYANEIQRQIGPERVRYIVPPGLSVVSGDGIGVLRGAPHRAVAEKFVGFVLSREGQTLWRAEVGSPGGPVTYHLGKLPVRPEIYDRVPSSDIVRDNPFRWSFSLRYDADLGGKRWRVVNELFGAFVTEVHRPLRDATARMHAGEGDPLVFQMPVSEEEAATVAAERTLDDPVKRAQLLRRWREISWQRFPADERAVPLAYILPLAILAAALGWYSLRANSRR